MVLNLVYSCSPRMRLSHLDVEAELLQAFEEGLLVAGHKGLHVRVNV